MNFIQQCYWAALNNIPSPGSGCHTSLLKVANFGVKAGTQPQGIHDDIRTHIPQGTRRISDKEISDAINKALADQHRGTFMPKARSAPIVDNGRAVQREIISQGKYADDADLWECSPIRLLDGPEQDPSVFIQTLFKPDDLLFIGERHQTGVIAETIRTSQDWIINFRNGGTTAPHIIVNPLTGLSVEKKSGDGETLRGDGNVALFRYCIGEFDNIPREEQIRFWSSAKLPIVALIDTGGKSIHAWLDVQKLAQVETSEQWMTEIKGRLYGGMLGPLGIDGACSNPARLSRLPGHLRAEKGTFQRLLWLAREGRYAL